MTGRRNAGETGPGVFRSAFSFFFNRVSLAMAAAWFAASVWVVEPFELSSRGNVAFGYLMLAILSLMCGVYYGAAWSISGFAPRGRRWLAFPAAFALMEWVRGAWYITYPMVSVSFIWAWSPVISQSMAIAGMYGLTFLTALFFSALFARHWKTAGAVAASVLAFGAWRLSLPDPATGYRVRIAALETDGSEAMAPRDVDRLLELSRLPGRDGVDLFVWPETAVYADLRYAASLRDRMAALNDSRSFLIAGFRRKDYDMDRYSLYNSMGVFDSRGLAAVYDKRMLAPFGEYVPPLVPIRSFLKHEYAPGAEARAPMRVGKMTILPFICHEIIFEDNRIPADVDFMVNISSDGWFPERGKKTHNVAVAIAAITRGVPIIRATKHGISSVISPYGRIVASMDGAGVLDAYLPARSTRTLFSITGNWLLIPTLALWLLYMIALPRLGKKY